MHQPASHSSIAGLLAKAKAVRGPRAVLLLMTYHLAVADRVRKEDCARSYREELIVSLLLFQY